MRILTKILLPLLLLTAAAATLSAAGEYNFTATSGSVTAYKFTIRVPSGKAIQGRGLDIGCSAACTIEYLNGGTTPTTATTAPVPTDPGAVAGSTLLYAGSDSTGGTRLSIRSLYGAGILPIDWSRIQYGGGRQVTISVTAGAAVVININGSFTELR